MMADSSKHTEKEKALKKLIRKWLMAQETQGKANLLLAKHPGIRRAGKGERK